MKRRNFTTLLTASALGAAAAPALSACSNSGGGSGDGTSLVIWHYENEDSAMGQAWALAQEIFEEKHPEVTVTVEKQTFEQLQKNATIVLTGDDVPDLMEFNKGNSTAGQLASQGLIEPFTDVAAEKGWDQKLSESLQATSRYDEFGLMGSGDWFGLPNYGEYVYVFYNKAMFDEAGVSVPTTLEEFEDVLQTFVDQGIVPLAGAGAEYPAGQLWYQLVLAHADRSFVDAYQLFDGEVDWAGDPILSGAQRFADWVDKGYLAGDSAGLTAEDMGTAFIAGTYPIMFSGSWWFGRLVAEMEDDWGQFLFPGTEFAIGSSGNLWVVPANAANQDLAYEFMDITMSQEVQDLLGQKGGLPVAGDTDAIEDERTREMTENFAEVNEAEGLAFYPDWPVAGFYDQLVSAMQSLINGSTSPEQAMAELGETYSTGRSDLTGE